MNTVCKTSTWVLCGWASCCGAASAVERAALAALALAAVVIRPPARLFCTATGLATDGFVQRDLAGHFRTLERGSFSERGRRPANTSNYSSTLADRDRCAATRHATTCCQPGPRTRAISRHLRHAASAFYDLGPGCIQEVRAGGSSRLQRAWRRPGLALQWALQCCAANSVCRDWGECRRFVSKP